MRIIPPYSGASPLARHNRPPDDAMGAPLRKAVAEADRLAAALDEAHRTAGELAAPERDAEAKAADDTAAAEAIRAGKPLPPATAAAELAAQRDVAARTVTATAAALAAAEGNCHQARQSAWEAIADTHGKTRADARDRLAAMAAALADDVQCTISELAVADWLRTGVYFTGAETSAIDVVPALAMHGMERKTAPRVAARDVLTRTVTTLFDTEGN